MPEKTARYFRHALWLGYFTVLFNLLEGGASVFFGLQNASLTLFGFGVDSFIEVISGLGIVAMVLRIGRNPETFRSRFERTALRITATSFYVLAAGLLVTASYNLATGYKPESTLPGLIISVISILTMWALTTAKRRVGRALDSAPILADANCTLVCIYMSLVLLAASLIYGLTGIGFIDSLGALGLIWFSISEGRESLEKAKGMECSCRGECTEKEW
jgi:divalent metal cation (Fe/Co/Zn/Cd) transporter